MFIFETSQLIEQLEQSILTSEQESCFTEEAINEIFRMMHTIKGSAAMMMFDNISTLAHTMEDIFDYLREHNSVNVDCSALSDLVLEGVDFIKVEMEKIKNRDRVDGDASALIANLKEFLSVMKQDNSVTPAGDAVSNQDISRYQAKTPDDPPLPGTYNFKAVIYFENGCGMEAVRAYSIIHNLEDVATEFYHLPEDLGDNAGSEVHIVIKDDGRGLKKEKILQKAKENGLLEQNSRELTDKEIFHLIFLPGFSTKDDVSEFSGSGVGMDVVLKNIEAVGGTISIDSKVDQGTTIILKIPLTLAIIDGMNIRVGHSCYTIPTISIKESFRPEESDIIRDPEGNEMVMVRGQCYPILRLHKFFKVKSAMENFSEGIMIMIEHDQKTLCVFADELLGQQQVVVKALPAYVRHFNNIRGLAGCTLLGDGSISLILDVAGLINHQH